MNTLETEYYPEKNKKMGLFGYGPMRTTTGSPDLRTSLGTVRMSQ